MKDTSGNLLKEAVLRANPFSVSGLMERMFSVFFGGLVYTQVWEDPRVDMEALELQNDSRVLMISSGGCNILNYLKDSPEHITAVDINSNHMALTRLKIAGMAHLPGYDDFFSFFGRAEGEKNKENYYKFIKPHIDEDSAKFWETNRLPARVFRGPRINYFSRNFYRYGAMGYFIRFLHMVARMKGLNPRDLLASENMQEQEGIFAKLMEPLIKNRFLKTFGKSPFFLFCLGIPPQQFKYLMNDCGGDIMSLYFERVKRLACGFPVNDNYFTWQAFACAYDNEARRSLPDYLKRRNYKILKANINRVHTHISSLTQYVKTQEKGSLDRFIFLDAQDWMSPAQVIELWREIARVGRPGSKIVFRTASSHSPVESSLPPRLRRRFLYHVKTSRELFKKDRSAIYGGFHLYSLKQPRATGWQ